jgi:hypothetical protein
MLTPCIRWCGFLLIAALPLVATAQFDPTNWTGTVHYVSPNGGHVRPYTNWTTAATNIQAALDTAQDGAAVAVTNGVYDALYDMKMTNANLLVAVFDALAVIDGGYPARSNRCLVVDHPDAVVEGFTIRNGYATGEDNAKGGGVWLRLGTLKKCVVVSNTAYHFNPTNFSPDGEGGGVCVEDGSSWTNAIIDCVVQNNTAGRHGAGVYADGGCVQDSTISGNTSYTNWWESLLQGGGVHARGNATIQGCTIQGNSAFTGGGVSLAGNATLRDSQVRKNQAEEGGGAEFVDPGCEASGCCFSGNSAVYGGGIWMSGGELCSSTIASNTAHHFDGFMHSGEGGGVRMYGGALTGCTVVNNRAAARGAGVCAEQATITDCVIGCNSNSWPSECRGGGLNGVYLVTATRCVISNNQATTGGGAELGQSAWLENGMLCGNRANWGGGICASGSDAAAWHCTIVSNTALQGGGVLCDSGGSFKLVNSIVYYNTAGAGSNHYQEIGSTCTFSNCCTGPVPADSECVSGPPRFAGVPTGTYRLKIGSPCIDAGTDDHYIVDDLDHVPRPLDGDGLNGAQFDIGAHEHASAVLDSDGDGRDDGSEAICGSNPKRADSEFRVRLAVSEDGCYLITTWYGAHHRRYTLRSANGLGGGWSDVANCVGIPGEGRYMRGMVDPGAGLTLEYYRVNARWGAYQGPSCP